MMKSLAWLIGPRFFLPVMRALNTKTTGSALGAAAKELLKSRFSS
jgi:hypothetical protein